MTLKEKLDRLRQRDSATFKWTAGSSGRIAGGFILLSQLRLNVLTVCSGTIVLSSSAPILEYRCNRPVITMSDKDVVTLCSASGAGRNKFIGNVKHGDGKVVPARCCGSWVLESDRAYPEWITRRVLSMGCSDLYPAMTIVMPDIYRLTRDLESIKPVLTSGTLSMIGASRGMDLESVCACFRRNIRKFGVQLPDGWLLMNDHVSSGGCCVVSQRGITARSGSVCHEIDPGRLAGCISNRRWHIATAKEVHYGNIDGDARQACKESAGISGDDNDGNGR